MEKGKNIPFSAVCHGQRTGTLLGEWISMCTMCMQVPMEARRYPKTGVTVVVSCQTQELGNELQSYRSPWDDATYFQDGSALLSKTSLKQPLQTHLEVCLLVPLLILTPPSLYPPSQPTPPLFMFRKG
ncbi:hypothetical protein STEG23_007249, partial [Scotinomys teguina]